MFQPGNSGSVLDGLVENERLAAMSLLEVFFITHMRDDKGIAVIGEMKKNEQIWEIITGKISMTYWLIR